MSQTKAQLIDGKSATIQFTGGSAAVPSVTFTGDLDTGIYSPGANQVAISTGGTERLLLTGGNVAIGVASPSAKLHISGSFWATNGELAGGNTASTGTDGTFRLLSSGGINYFQFGQNRTGGSTAPLVFGNIFGAAEYMRITSDGKLGLGTSVASAGLTVALGNNSIPAAGATGAAALFGNSISAQTYGLILGAATTGAGYIQAQRADGVATTYDLHLQPNGGRVGVGTTSPSDVLHVVGGGRFTGSAVSLDVNGAFIDYSSNIARIAGCNSTGGAIAFLTNPNGGFNTERARIDSSGRVGIGTTSPQFDLTVAKPGTGVTSILGIRAGESGSASTANAATLYYRIRGGGPGDVDASTTFSYNGAYLLQNSAQDGHTWSTSAGEAMRIDSSRRLLVGTSSSTMSGGVVQQNGNLGIIANNGLNIATNGTLDITINSGGGCFTGFMIVENTLATNAASRTQTLYAVMGRGTSATFTSLATANGSTSGASFTLSCPSNGVIRVTNTHGGATNINLCWYGPTGF